MHISRIEAGDQRRLQGLLGIYRASIEPSEQKPPHVLDGMLLDPRYAFLALEHGEDVCGFAIVFVPATRDFWLLEFMAVDAAHRGEGFGEALLRASVAYGGSLVPGAIGVLEVDEPGGLVSPGNDPVARLRFYARQGCRKVEGLRYILPLDVAGTPPPMQLLVHASANVRCLRKDKLRTWLVTLYVDVYGQSRADARIDAMLSPLLDTVELIEL